MSKYQRIVSPKYVEAYPITAVGDVQSNGLGVIEFNGNSYAVCFNDFKSIKVNNMFVVEEGWFSILEMEEFEKKFLKVE